MYVCRRDEIRHAMNADYCSTQGSAKSPAHAGRATRADFAKAVSGKRPLAAQKPALEYDEYPSPIHLMYGPIQALSIRVIPTHHTTCLLYTSDAADE